jgi:hypothetical protein
MTMITTIMMVMVMMMVVLVVVAAEAVDSCGYTPPSKLPRNT